MGESIRKWFWFDNVILGLRIYWYMLLFAGMTGPFEGRAFRDEAVMVSLWLIGGLIIPLFFWCPGKMKPIIYIMLEFILAGGLCVYYMISLQQTTAMLTIPTLIVGYVSPKKTVYWSAPLFISIFFLTKMFIPLPIEDVLTQTMYLLILYGIGFLFHFLIDSNNRTNALMEEVEQKNAAITQYANQVEQLTLLEERNRMARELHDSIGHRFTSIITSLDVAVELINLDTNGTKQRLVDLSTYTREGLNEIRKNIHEIAPDDDTKLLSLTLQSMIKEFEVHTGTSTLFKIDGEENNVNRNIKLTMVRCLQELITNSKRHGEATIIEILLSFTNENIKLTVQDNGKGFKAIKQGFGLKAMKERLELINGGLTIWSDPLKGTTAVCTIPLKRG
jgi:signal transduction histidine kinase